MNFIKKIKIDRGFVRVRGKFIFYALAVTIAIASLVVSDKLIDKMAQEERQKIELWAEASRILANNQPESADALILTIIRWNTTIPIIVTWEDGQIINSKNIKLPRKNPDKFLYKELKKFRNGYPPIKIELSNGTQYLYYSDSYTLHQLLLFPYIQLGAFFIFIITAIVAITNTKRAEQNRIWEGLARETAHQLGTPISSLMAWNEILKASETDPTIVDEIDKDIDRLEIIADRFQKVGSEPTMVPHELGDVLRRSTDYMRLRISRQVNLTLMPQPTPVHVNISESLISWVFENLIKNAVDAMNGAGSITISYKRKGRNVLIDVKDTGKGIPKSKTKDIFKPGFTTRKRGWGLGLSLARRIIEEYHQGKIFVKQSEVGAGTTFRIVLPAED
ncbi:HAMP domain-containing sensor histidine kinase [Porphyromonas pogonae]|uniref:sensor histidine kinase n=1 Tax=Porphyromonas pogonae TaxID=867595 RepID=UPI002E76D223|nr:HAMP domain-containing sensor histidine kinase [Porphyromonas pogonae]